MIYVEHDGGIRIEFNFRDAFEEALEILKAHLDLEKLYFSESSVPEGVQVV